MTKIKKTPNNWVVFPSMKKYTPSEHTHGIVYMIIDREEDKGYIGKKQVYKEKALGKRELAKLDSIDKRRKYTKRVYTDWQTYLSSCRELRSLIESVGDKKNERFEFIVLSECYDETALKYAEVEAIVKNNALNSPQFYNDNIRINQIGAIQKFDERSKILCE